MEVPGRKKDKSADVLCDPCLLLGRNTKAEHFCADCNEFFCDDCCMVHKVNRYTRNHKLLDSGNMPKQKLESYENSVCSKHSGKGLDYICEDHNSIFCSVCVTLNHKNCNLLFIDDIATDYDKTLAYKSLTDSIASLTKQSQEMKDMLIKKVEELQKSHGKFIRDVKAFRKEINQILDTIEGTIIKEADDLKEDHLKLAVSDTAMCDNILAELNIASEKMREQLRYMQHRQLVISAKETQIKGKEYDAKLVEMAQGKSMEFEFVRNENLLQSLQSFTTMGDIKQSQNTSGSRAMPQQRLTEAESIEVGSDSDALVTFSSQNTSGSRAMPQQSQNTSGSRAMPQQKDDHLVFETFYHRSGKEFQCRYQGGKRFYLDDWGSKEWQPFPKKWYNEGLLVTNTVLKDDSAAANGEQVGASGQQRSQDRGQTESMSLGLRRGGGIGGDRGSDDREGFIMHPKRGRIPTYIFNKKHNVHMYFDRDTDSWVRMPIGWELHHNMVKDLVDKVEEAIPTWKDRADILSLLRACNYDASECISIYRHLERDEWMRVPKTSKDVKIQDDREKKVVDLEEKVRNLQVELDKERKRREEAKRILEEQTNTVSELEAEVKQSDAHISSMTVKQGKGAAKGAMGKAVKARKQVKW